MDLIGGHHRKRLLAVDRSSTVAENAIFVASATPAISAHVGNSTKHSLFSGGKIGCSPEDGERQPNSPSGWHLESTHVETHCPVADNFVVWNYGSTFHAQEEAQLANKAGTEAEQLVKHAVLRLIEAEMRFGTPVPELPVWDLGAIGPLHRCDLYDDAG